MQVLGEYAFAEQQTEGIGEVVEVQIRRVVVAFACPHVRMTHVFRQTVAVGGILGTEHGILQLVHAHHVISTGIHHFIFKEVAAVDVNHRLRCFHQAVFQQGELLLFCSRGKHLMRQHGFVEDGCRLRQRHGRFNHAVRQASQAAIVPGVSQLMGNGADIGETSLEIGHHQTAVFAVHTGAESTACLSFPGIHIDPPLLKGIVHKICHLGRELAHFQQQLGTSFLNGVGMAAVSYRGKEIIEGKTVFIAQVLGLGTQVAAEVGQILPNGRPHGVQRFLIHPALVQGHVQHGVEFPCLGQGAGFHLNAVQAVGHGKLDLLIGSNFRLVGILADGSVRVIGHTTNGRQGQVLTTVVHHVVGIQLVPQLAEGGAAA